MSILLRPILNISLNWLLVTRLPSTQKKSVKYLQKAITPLSISSNSNLYDSGLFIQMEKVFSQEKTQILACPHF